jgi:hypothetical protein
MQFETSVRIHSTKSPDELTTALFRQFEKISSSVERGTLGFTAKGIEATFGSVNRKDTTVVSVREKDGDCLVVADVNYRPSGVFWLLLILLLFSWVGWLIPIAFYLYQKGTVRTAVENALERVKVEFSNAPAVAVPTQAPASMSSELQNLAQLRAQGILTEEEFVAAKQRLLAH